MPRVRFAPSPTGFLHIGSARTFIFNWLYARHNGGTMILRIDDTDVERNTQASLDSIFDGLNWLDLGWDEIPAVRAPRPAPQSGRRDLRKRAWPIAISRLAQGGDSEKSGAHGTWLFNAGMRELSREESDRRAAAGEPFVLRFRVPRDRVGARALHTMPSTASSPKPTPISKTSPCCAATACRRIIWRPAPTTPTCASRHIIRGQDHLTNTFKHVLIFEAAGAESPAFAHLPLLIAPDGTKLSKRKHGPVVSVTTYRDAGFLPQAFVNFLCLLGWSPKDDREKLSRQETDRALHARRHQSRQRRGQLHGGRPVRSQGVWLNAEHIRALPVDELARDLLPFVPAGFAADPESCARSRR